MEILNLAVFGDRPLGVISGDSSTGSTWEGEPLTLRVSSGSEIAIVIQTMARTHVPGRGVLPALAQGVSRGGSIFPTFHFFPSVFLTSLGAVWVEGEGQNRRPTCRGSESSDSHTS